MMNDFNRDAMKKYMDAINTSEEFKTTIEEFKEWLNENRDEKGIFRSELREVEFNDYYVAWDFRIPVVMVKYFRRRGV